MLTSSTIVDYVWFVFVLYWLIVARRAQETAQKRSQNLLVVVVALVFVFLAVRSKISFGMFAFSPVVQNIGAIICILGLAFAVWARIYIGRSWGMPMTVQSEAEMVTSGPYAFVRHPIYTGLITAMIGSLLVEGFLWVIVLVVVGGYCIYSFKVEERLMLKQFPDKYPQYMKRTKSFIPFLY